jgi:FMS-like tyrosine kinase 1
LINHVHGDLGELLVIVEYCRFGNIQNYLIRNRSGFINQVDARGYINPSIGADLLIDAEAQFVLTIQSSGKR